MSTEHVKHEKFWFSDGNVVLNIARIEKETTYQIGRRHGLSDATIMQLQGPVGKRKRTEDSSYTGETRVLFRVHKSILSKHSPVFEGMFTLPEIASGSENAGASNRPGSLDEMYEGAPVVELSDTEEQIVGLLGVFYDPFSLSLEPRNYYQHLCLLPLMEIAHKYQVDTITSRIIKCIEAGWPQELKELDAIEELLKKVHKNSRYDFQLRIQALREPVFAINFARRFHAENILPAAFQLLLRTRYSEDWDDWGLLRDIPTGSNLPMLLHGVFERFTRTNRACWGRLSREDYLLLGKIHDNVKAFLDNQLFEDVIAQPFRQCVDSQHDHREMKLLRADIRDTLRSARDVFGAISEYCDSASERRIKFTFCRPCNDYVQDHVLFNIRFRLWKVVKDTVLEA